MATKRKIDPFFWIAVFSTVTVVVFIVFPLTEMVFQPSVQDLKDTIYDPDCPGFDRVEHLYIRHGGLDFVFNRHPLCLFTGPEEFFRKKAR